MINFVSNLPRDLRSGGFSATNAASFAALSSIEEVHYVGPINPPAIFRQKALSKILRTVRLRGDFFFYSQKRLERIAGEVHAGALADAALDFFHGFTPWILTAPARRYIAWSDCAFHDYIRIYHSYECFNADDLVRIERTEAAWLKRAHRVLFSTRWAAERAIDAYGLDAAHVATTGTFGEIEMPAADGYAGAKEFAFVSTDFEAKGGSTVLSAFRKVRQRHADACLVIVGAQPPSDAKEPGVTVAGYLRKEVPEEYALFRKTLAAARALVHPTNSDISPHIIVEAGYFGCPAITSNRFAIPEARGSRRDRHPSRRRVGERCRRRHELDARKRGGVPGHAAACARQDHDAALQGGFRIEDACAGRAAAGTR